MGQVVLIAGFTRSDTDGSMQCEGVPIERITRAVGTPVYVYSSAVIRDRYERLASILSPVQHRIHYTLKANPNRAVLRLLRGLGAGVDVVSAGELRKAQAAGFDGKDIIFGGVGKTADELREAVAAKVMLINVESEAEIRLLNDIAGKMKATAPVGIRVNPELNLHAAHDYIKTGGKGHKFGIPFDEALEVARAAAALPHVKLVGLDMHLGSQLSRIEPYKIGAERLLELHTALRNGGVNTIKYLDIGGGLGVRYDDEKPPNLDLFAKMVLPLVESTGLTLIMEPGRFIIGNAGALVGVVLYRKTSGDKEYVIADIGMTELLRPSHYGAFHRIEPVRKRSGKTTADIVGPVCESGDFLALDREIADVQPGDQILVHDVGAYGYVMASNYNARRRAAEVLVDGDRFAVVTRRETFEDLMRLDVDEPSWTRENE